MTAPVLVEVRRGSLVESTHAGSIVVLGPDGRPVLALGDVTAPFYPRSSVKPLQASALVAAGFGVRDEGLALAASSHSGEKVHIAGVTGVLSGAGLTAADLRNTPDLPLGEIARDDYLRAGGVADPLHQNCSGKHAAMLATCVVNGWDTAGYLAPDAPVQRAVRSGLDDLLGEPTADPTTDGCGAPLFSTSLVALARSFAVLAAAAGDTPAGVVAGAMRAHPELVGGSGRDVTDLMRALPGCVAKDGAEGVYALGLPDGSAVALKMTDGSARGRLPALLAGLAHLRLHPDVPVPPVLGGGEPVGTLTATF